MMVMNGFWAATLVARQDPPAAPGSYETTVTLRASEILQPGVLSGPQYRVREDVVTDWGVNTYAVDSGGYGTLLARGNSQLLERIAEGVAMKESLIYDKDANELRVLHQSALLQMGVSATDALALLSNAAFTPWQQTQFVTSLQKLVGVRGRDLFVRDAAIASTDDKDASFYAGTARLLAWLATQNHPIDRIELKNNAPYCDLRDGSVLLALHWDYARWSPTADKCATWLQTLQVDGRKPPSVTLAISGAASPRCRQEMEKRGFRVLDRLDRGPLKWADHSPSHHHEAPLLVSKSSLSFPTCRWGRLPPLSKVRRISLFRARAAQL